MQVIVADPSFNFSLLQKLNEKNKLKLIQLPLPLDTNKLNQAFALFIRTRVKINEELLSQAPHLKVLISGTSGKEHIDEDICHKSGIKVFFTGDILSIFVAEYILLLMLQLSWKNISAMKAIKDGKWKDHLKKGDGLYGKFLGIIGFGHIGKELAKKAQAFDMKVGAYSPNTPKHIFQEHKTISMSQDELLKKADFISLNVSYRKDNQNLISSKEFAMMKPSAYFINTSRGSMVCEQSLVKAIKEKQIQGAALDVFIQEPLPINSPLQNHNNIILTPHYATHNQQALDLLTLESFSKLKEVIQ